VKEESRGEQFNAPERWQPPFEEYIPKIDITHLKMDALQSLQTMSDGSLDSVMINNVDYSIVSDDDYIADLQKELERVIKKDGIIFGWSADRVRPKDANIVYQENGRIWFKIIQNTRK